VNKKQIRDNFRNSVFKRDKNKCVMCGKKDGKLDAHHITDRSLMPSGGYTPFNGITLCAGDDKDNCHWKAEQYHITGVAHPNYSPEDLYGKIGSSYEKAIKESERL
jgi:5-methylcytosine-specific restriction endonuclease McrA